jgi:hypothetical protein
MPRPVSLHLELPISENQLLSALFLLPQIEELKIMPLHPLGTKFWSALTPRGAGGRKKEAILHQVENNDIGDKNKVARNESGFVEGPYYGTWNSDVARQRTGRAEIDAPSFQLG